MPLQIRIYAGFAGQSGRIAAVREELQVLLRRVAGLRRFLLLETAEGLAMVTEGESREACEDCASRAERWMTERMPALKEYQPLEAKGEVICEVNLIAREARSPAG